MSGVTTGFERCDIRYDERCNQEDVTLSMSEECDLGLEGCDIKYTMGQDHWSKGTYV